MKITIEFEGRNPVEILEEAIWEVQHMINIDESSCFTHTYFILLER